jgi:TonB family protein
MQEQRSKTEAGTGGYRDRRRMFLALVLLLAALLVVVVKNREIWFGSDNDTAADNTPVWIPSHAGQTPSAAAPVAKAKSAVTPKVSTQPAAGGATVVATTRTVLQPLGIEVVAGGARQAARTVSNSVKVEMLSDTTSSADQGWSPATNAADRTRLASDQTQVSQSAPSSYPLLAQQMKVQGSVLLQVLIGVDGAIRELRVLNGPAILASAARDAVRQWRFKPYMQNGHAVETSANVTVNFTIKVLDKATRDQLGPVALATSGE